MLAFITHELKTNALIDGMERLVLQGRFDGRIIEQVIHDYIENYVQCKMCNRLDTILTRDFQNRLYTKHCLRCGAIMSVKNVKPLKSKYIY